MNLSLLLTQFVASRVNCDVVDARINGTARANASEMICSDTNKNVSCNDENIFIMRLLNCLP